MMSSYGLGVNSENMLLMQPKYWRGDPAKAGIIYCHGYGETELECFRATTADNQLNKLVTRIVEEVGVPVLSCFLGGNQWGNASAQTKLAAAVSYMSATLGASSSKIGFIGNSMGALASMNWIAQNRAKTAFMFSSMGVADLANIRANATYTAAVDAAYSGGYSDATYGATCNPTVNAATKYSGLKWLCYGGSSDTVVPPSTITNLKNAIGSTGTYNQVAGGHAQTTVDNYNAADIISFINANIAA